MDTLLSAYKSKGINPDEYLNVEFTEDGQKKILKKSTSQAVDMTQEEQELLKIEFNRVQNKTKDMIKTCDYVRKKHFKSNTLRYGEGQLFMNKGLRNRDYESTVLKKCLQ